MKIGVFGGTFNPIHNGHMSFCLQCKQILGLDKMLLIPTNIPPHKCAGGMASNADRLAMIRLATAPYDFIEVSDIEFQISGISYTYNTLIEIKKAYSGDDIFLVIGADMLAMFNKWYRYLDILEEATVVVGARENDQLEFLMQLKKNKLANSQAIVIINIMANPMSSTKIRELVKENESLEGYLESSVLDYIKTNKLYIGSEEDDKLGL